MADTAEPQEMLDAIVIGAGPAGLSAAIYLGRFRRPCLIVDAGHSRVSLIHRARNYPGDSSGTKGVDILESMRGQAVAYGVNFIAGRVDRLTREGEGFAAHIGPASYQARSVFLATGVRDIWPPLERLSEGLASEVIAVCPVCHAFEATGSVAVLARDDRAVGEAKFLSRTADVTVLDISEDGFDKATAASVLATGVRLSRVSPSALTIQADYVQLTPAEGAEERFDRLFIALGATPQTELAQDLGIALTESGHVKVDNYRETSVSDVFAIGDVAAGLDQIVVAQGDGAIAASHFHARQIGCI